MAIFYPDGGQSETVGYRASSLSPKWLMFDYCDHEIETDQKVAIGQLGVHLAAAYFDYCGDGQPNVAPNGGPTEPLGNSGVSEGPSSVS